jgi:hypothetical protein
LYNINKIRIFLPFFHHLNHHDASMNIIIRSTVHHVDQHPRFLDRRVFDPPKPVLLCLNEQQEHQEERASITAKADFFHRICTIFYLIFSRSFSLFYVVFSCSFSISFFLSMDTHIHHAGVPTP